MACMLTFAHKHMHIHNNTYSKSKILISGQVETALTRMEAPQESGTGLKMSSQLSHKVSQISFEGRTDHETKSKD